jgi:ABC-type transport system substrate-binding protein
MEGNSEMFNYLYNYMVSGMFPLFYEYNKGFDYGKYARLLSKAEYQGVNGMIDWLKGKKYEDAVKLHISSIQSNNLASNILPGNMFYGFHLRTHVQKPRIVQGAFLFTGVQKEMRACMQ